LAYVILNKVINDQYVSPCEIAKAF